MNNYRNHKGIVKSQKVQDLNLYTVYHPTAYMIEIDQHKVTLRHELSNPALSQICPTPKSYKNI